MGRPLILLSLLNINVAAQSFVRTQVCHNINYGVAFEIAPDGRFFVTEKGSDTNPKIKVFSPNGSFISTFYEFGDSLETAAESGLLGITLDPNFSSNHHVYAYFILEGPLITSGDERIVIQRFTDINNLGTDPVTIFDYYCNGQSAGIHVGGNIHFRPSDSTHLYVSIGDFITGVLGTGPALLDNPFGKIVRISKYPDQPPPTDNPFYDDGNPLTGNCDWIWAYGLRNSFDFCFGPNDSLYATENGAQTFDEINLITRGGFYGWPYCEGTNPGPQGPCTTSTSIPPLIQIAAPLPALTGIVFYTSNTWNEQQNHLITVDYMHSNLRDFTLGNAPNYDIITDSSTWIDGFDLAGFTDVMQGSDGCLYVMLIRDSTFGGIYKFCPHADSTWSLNAGPNPFNTTSTIWYSVATEAHVNVSLYDVRGRLVHTFQDGIKAQGQYSIDINAQQMKLTSGTYICKLTTEHFNSAIKLIVE